MISFIIDFENSVDCLRFISSIEEYNIITEYSVKQGRLLDFTLVCKTFSDGLMLVTTVNNLLEKLKIDVRPYSFCYSELLD